MLSASAQPSIGAASASVGCQETISRGLRGRCLVGFDGARQGEARNPTEGQAMAQRNSGDYAVVWPRSAKAVEIKPLSRRLDSIEGKTIAFLWDDLFRGDEIWPILKGELSNRFTNVSFVDHDAFGSTHGDEEHRVLAELPEKIKSMKIDAVVSGMGC